MLARNSDGGTRDKLDRLVLKTDRTSDFFDGERLIAITGYQTSEWPAFTLREMVDNSLDSCEEAGVPPQIEVELGHDHVSARDNGKGIAPGTVTSILDFSATTSSKRYVCAPDRGMMGAAVQSVFGVAYVLGCRSVEILGAGARHLITLRPDPVLGKVQIEHHQEVAATEGTTVRLNFGKPGGSEISRFTSILLGQEDSIWRLFSNYAAFNPHLSFRVSWFDKAVVTYPATNPEWQRWWAHKPSAIEWYDEADWRRLITARVANGHDSLVADFVGEFRGFSKPKPVLDELGLHRVRMSELRDGQVEALLSVMKSHSRQVRPEALGTVGEDHVRGTFERLGADWTRFATGG